MNTGKAIVWMAQVMVFLRQVQDKQYTMETLSWRAEQLIKEFMEGDMKV